MSLLWYNYPIKEGQIMPKIIPIKELKNTSNISLMVRESEEPVYVTKNGYADMVLMSAEKYDRMMYEMDIRAKLLEGERAIQRGEVEDAFESIERISRKYGI